MIFYHYSVGFKTFFYYLTSYYNTILHEFVVVIVVVANTDTLKSPKNQHLVVDGFHCREPYNQFFETLYMPSNPYFIRFSNFTLYHISSLFCTESEDFGTKLVQNWYKIGTRLAQKIRTRIASTFYLHTLQLLYSLSIATRRLLPWQMKSTLIIFLSLLKRSKPACWPTFSCTAAHLWI